MNFALNEEQIALQDAVHNFFETKSTSEIIRKAMHEHAGFEASLYESMCGEMGLTSLIVTEEYGGFGASDIELNLAIEEHGYYLVPSPLRVHSFATILLQECANDEAKTKFLPLLAEGSQIATVAFEDFDQVLFADIAKHLFFVKEKKLYYLDLEQDSVEIVKQKSIDPTQHICRIEFNLNNAQEISDCDIGDSYKVAKSRMTILLANEMLGASRRLFDMSLQYSKEREQFGKAIASFQIIKHMLSDMYVELEKVSSICLYGAYLSSEKDQELDIVAAMSKYQITKVFTSIAKDTIQIHGGIGFTYEHDAHLYLKRAAFSAYELGSKSEHCEAIAEAIFS